MAVSRYRASQRQTARGLNVSKFVFAAKSSNYRLFSPPMQCRFVTTVIQTWVPENLGTNNSAAAARAPLEAVAGAAAELLVPRFSGKYQVGIVIRRYLEGYCRAMTLDRRAET